MIKEKSFIFSKEFDEAMKNVKKVPYLEIEKQLKEFSKKTSEIINEKNISKED
ncbi:hypothetical protein [Clostridium arbusti]|uniref:hypothetical protein n=1 Tax=Clostridium arbusti TaxID=1137848 RepID=UPI0002E60586|nr:hypothetical protein [Clostridium arbusti]